MPSGLYIRESLTPSPRGVGKSPIERVASDRVLEGINCQLLVKRTFSERSGLTGWGGSVGPIGMNSNESTRHVFRDLIEEKRDRYSVCYQPADLRSPIATLSLFYSVPPKDMTIVAAAMESELENWLKRFPVPVKVSAFNSRKRSLRVSPNPSECHLMGYVRLFDDAVIRRWGEMDESAIPAETLDPEHLASAYSSIPFRVCEEDRERDRRAFRARMRNMKTTLLLLLVFPSFIFAILHWERTLAIPIVLLSVAAGAYKGAGLMGWGKPSRREQRRAELLERKEHYFFHCEKHPSGFARLEKENFKREVTRENKEAKRLLQDVSVRKTRPRPRWILLPQLFRAKG